MKLQANLASVSPPASRCARLLSGPSVTKGSVNTAPGPIKPLASGMFSITSSAGRFALALANGIDVAVQEKSEEGADPGDRGHSADLVPGRRDGRFHDVGRKLERE